MLFYSAITNKCQLPKVCYLQRAGIGKQEALPCQVCRFQPLAVLYFIIISSSLLVYLFLQPEDHRPMYYIHTITGEHRL